MVSKSNSVIKRWVLKSRELLNISGAADSYFSAVFLPLVIVVFYFFSFAFLHSFILKIPNGVNYDFTSRSWKYLALLAAGSFMIFFAIAKFTGGKKLAFRRSGAKLSPGDFLLLLLPLTPVVQYIINNQDILSLSGSLLVILVFVVFSGAYVFLIPASLGFPGSTRKWISLGLAFTYTVTNMASLTHTYAWFGKGSLKIQWVFFAGTLLIIWIFFRLNDRKVLRLLVVLIFISNTAMQLMARDALTAKPPLPEAEHKLQSLVEGKNPVVTPNIYLLVYDAYVANETMLAYSIDNSAQEQFLEGLGFKLYPHTYSIESNSLGTMSSVLNASIDSYGNRRLATSGNGVIQNALSSFGYKTYGVFPTDYFFINIEPTYDYSYPGRPSSPDILSRAILMGEFRFDVGFNKQPRNQYIETKQRIIEGPPRGPIFFYSHSNLPNHSQNSGACLPNETELYQEKLTTANSEMRVDLEKVIENDPQAIIIVAGDHGPYLTKNCYMLENAYSVSEISRLDIQDRFGSFLAIRWPSEDASQYDDITVLQDLFPAVFAYLFKDEQILESKIDPTTNSTLVIVQNGILQGGIHEGEPLFLSEK